MRWSPSAAANCSADAYLFHRSTTMIEPNCCCRLFTRATARVKGVGRALINGVHEQAERAGASRVYWQTHGPTTPRCSYDKVAERSGFVVTARRSDTGLVKAAPPGCLDKS